MRTIHLFPDIDVLLTFSIRIHADLTYFKAFTWRPILYMLLCPLLMYTCITFQGLPMYSEKLAQGNCVCPRGRLHEPRVVEETPSSIKNVIPQGQPRFFVIFDRFIASNTYAVYKGCGLTIGTRRRHCPFGVQPVFSMVSDQHRRVLFPTLFDIRAGVFLRVWG